MAMMAPELANEGSQQATVHTVALETAQRPRSVGLELSLHRVQTMMSNDLVQFY
jgi:hypothetical protein